MGATFVTPDGVVLVDQKLLPGLRLLRAGMPVRLPLHSSREEGGGQVHALLPPHHQGTDDGVLRSLPDGSAAAGRPEESQRSDSRVFEDARVQVLKPQMATGAKAFYNGLDGSVR